MRRHIILFILSGCAAGQEIRATILEEAPSRCLFGIRVMCSDMAREMFVHLRELDHTTDFDSRMSTDSLDLPRSSTQVRACLRARIFNLRRSLHITNCAFQELTRLNQEATYLPFAEFARVSRQCGEDTYKNSPCQLYTWYSRVFTPNTGRSLDSLGVKNIDIFVDSYGRERRTTRGWTPPASVARDLIDMQIQRLQPPKEKLERGKPSRKRKIEDDAEWFDTLLDVLRDDAPDDVPCPITQVTPSVQINPDGLIEPPPPECIAPRHCSCADEYKQGLRMLQSGLERDSLLRVPDVLQRLGVKSRDKGYTCVKTWLDKFWTSLFIDEASFVNMLKINYRGKRVTYIELKESVRTKPRQLLDVCHQHLWYYYAINPFAGRTVGHMSLAEIPLNDAGVKSYAPAVNVVADLIKLEISRVSLD
jgi:hypothetical protein